MWRAIIPKSPKESVLVPLVVSTDLVQQKPFCGLQLELPKLVNVVDLLAHTLPEKIWRFFGEMSEDFICDRS
jgi:hypothetical protein